MKKEQKQLICFLLRMLVLLVFASLYAIGGSEDFWGGEKWIRRFLAPAVLCGFGLVVSKDWLYLLSYFVTFGALTLPYGADDTWTKVLLRLMCGLAVSAAINFPLLVRKNYPIVILGFVCGVIGSVLLGVWNPTPDAMIEQGSIAFLFGFAMVIGVNRKPKGGKS